MNVHNRNNSTYVIAGLALLSVVLVALFVLWGLNSGNWEYNLSRRFKKIAAIAITGMSIGLSSLMFQAITNNRILTPSVMGLDNLYLFIQTIIVFQFGSKQLVAVTAYSDFLLSTVFMVVFSLAMYHFVLKRSGRNIFLLVLVGLVFGSFFGGLASFMQVLIDPNEFQVLQGKMFASFNNVNVALLAVSSVIFFVILAVVMLDARKMDIVSLGRETAISLGVNFDRQVMIYLSLTAVLVSVSTALVGPITFLGILAVNLARQMLTTYKHSVIALGSMLLGVVALVSGQFFVERIFSFNTPISVIINFIGGIYFIWLLLKERGM